MPLVFDDTPEEFEERLALLREDEKDTCALLSNSIRMARERSLKIFESFCSSRGIAPVDTWVQFCSGDRVGRNNLQLYLDAYVRKSYQEKPILPHHVEDSKLAGNIIEVCDGMAKVKSVTKVSSLLSQWIHLYVAADNVYLRPRRLAGTSDLSLFVKTPRAALSYWRRRTRLVSRLVRRYRADCSGVAL